MMLCEFDPASGSVMEKANVEVPSAKPGNQACFCSSLPYCAMIVPTIAGDTTMSSSGLPAAASSSHTAARSPMSPPPPPYSSGIATPRKPLRPASDHSSVVFVPVRAACSK
jgi:hypothetical protein